MAKEQENQSPRVASLKPKKPSPLAVAVVQRAILSVFFGLAAALAGGFWPIRIENAEALADMRFGFPFPFIFQKYYGVLYENWFPGYAPPQFHAEACYTTLSAGNYFLSAGVFALVFFVILLVVMFFRRRRKVRRAFKFPKKD